MRLQFRGAKSRLKRLLPDRTTGGFYKEKQKISYQDHIKYNAQTGSTAYWMA